MTKLHESFWRARQRLLSFALSVCWLGFSAWATAQPSSPTASQPITRVPSVELIGRDLVDLLGQLTAAEKDSARRLPLRPVLEKVAGAVQRAPQFQLNLSNVNFLLGARDEARSGLLPQISGGWGNGQRHYDVPMGGDQFASYSGNYLNKSLTAKQLIYDFGNVGSGLEAAQKRLAGSELNVNAQRSEVFWQALRSFYEVQRAMLQLALAQENLSARQSFVRFIRERMSLGASSPADVVRAESRVADAQDALATSRQNLAQLQAAYRLYFMEDAQAYWLPVEIEIGSLQPRDLDDLTEVHPSVRQAQLNLQAAQHDLDSAKGRYVGGVFLEVSRTQTHNPGQSQPLNDQSAMLMLRSDLYTGGAQTAKIQQALARVTTAEFELEKIKQETQKAMREAFSEVEGTQSSVQARLQLFSGSVDAYSIAKDLYAFGRSSLFEVLKSQEDLFMAGQKLIDSLINRSLARFKLLHASHQLNETVNRSLAP